MSQFLGIDASTQSIDAVILDLDSGELQTFDSVKFDDIPGYECENGVLPNDDPLIKHSNPLLWLDGLEVLLQQLADRGVDFSKVSAISGSGQQHGTVYLNADFVNSRWDVSGKSLAETFKPLLARKTSPIWMDSSTSDECEEIAENAGGRGYVQRTTGSLPIERFSGPQIRKFYKEEPENYERTAEIHLVSSFLASVLAGESVAIDVGDGAGMNLMSLNDCDWDETMLEATSPGLLEKLPPVVPSSQVVGTVSRYLQENYGFSKDARVVAWSGDNPNSLIGTGGYAPGTAVISLGTSYTFFAAMEDPVVDPDGYGHVFGNPAGGFMSLICFKNGALAQEEIMKQFGISYYDYEKCFFETPVGNNGNMLLPYFVPEITPLVLEAAPVKKGEKKFVDNKAPAQSVRAVVEGQALRMKMHSDWIEEKTDVIRVTGGAAKSDANCQALADVFNARIERLQVGNAPALGAAMRAAQAFGAAGWPELTKQFCVIDPEKTLQPEPESVTVYEKMIKEYKEFTEQALS